MNIVQTYFLSDERQESLLGKKLMDGLLLSPLAEFNKLRNALKAAAFSKMGNATSIQMLLKFSLLRGRVQESLSQKQTFNPSDLSRIKRLQTLESILLSGIRHHQRDCSTGLTPVVLKWRRPAFELVALIKSLILLKAVSKPEGQSESECALIVRFCRLMGLDISDSTVRNLRNTTSGSIRQDTLFKQMGTEFRKWLNEEPRTRRLRPAVGKAQRTLGSSPLKSPPGQGSMFRNQ